MIFRTLRIACFVSFLFLTGCSSLAPFLATPTSVPVIQATSTPHIDPTQPAPDVAKPRILRVWVPPRFNPEAGTPSADLLKQRFAEFEADHPGLEIEVRIKAEDGETGLLNSLSITSMAAPSIAPDLIALTHSDMEAAVLKGLLHPTDGLTTLLQGPDWYGYARQLGYVQNTEFGLPFAADAMVILYRPAVFESAPSDWGTILGSGNQMVFSASDPQAYFPLSLYLSLNDQLTDDKGVFTLDETTLTRVLTYYRQVLDSGMVAPIIRDNQTDQEVLKNYREGNADVAVIWASSDLLTQSGEFTSVPGLDNSPYSLANGWVWALAGSSNENQTLAVELASHLVESDFMSVWTIASGYLPTRPQALAGWENEELKKSVDEILQSAYPVPSEDVMSAWGSLMREALVRIFNGDQPENVARSVIESIK
jgi:ABC-type glycerol-3-phosphate transport system substrate-binding protein